ncbi:50S ribosomal protein L13 [Desulfovibrio inopinatus]|uniref:50S ribosomal protein L13 n=1 Tax=Desulfovibrio inopinatus TaxID=102109 RepID=UPI00041CF1E6|nr:50S ribosomal protein L13 [Desulfovibrio inopinatus]
MKTYSPKIAERDREWIVVDAKDKVLGRLASEIAFRLMGKHKPEYAPHMDMGDFVVVLNAEKIKVTGRKMDTKMYYRHSGYIGGLTGNTLREVLDKKPSDVIYKAVRGMLPKNRIGRAMLKKLKVYAGEAHPHEAQQPQPVEL